MARVWSGTVAIAGVCVIAGCRHSTAPNEGPVLEVTKLEAPSVIGPGQSAAVTLMVGEGGCTVFDHIAESRSGSKVVLRAIGHNLNPAGYCLDYLKLSPRAYEIKPPLPSRFTVVISEPGIIPELSADVQVGFTIQ